METLFKFIMTKEDVAEALTYWIQEGEGWDFSDCTTHIEVNKDGNISVIAQTGKNKKVKK